MRKLIILFCLFSFRSNCQDIALGNWQYHIPFHKGIGVADAAEKVYCASEKGIYYFDKSDNSLNRFTRVSGLSEVRISSIAYNQSTNTLVVGYQNGNIDLVKNESIRNMADIKRSAFTGSKSINRITMYDHLAYLSCGFGVIVVDLQKQEIKETYLFNSAGNIAANDVCVSDGIIYTATSEGLYYASIENEFLNDPTQWTREVSLQDSSFNHVFEFNNKVYANFNNSKFRSDTLYYLEQGVWRRSQKIIGEDNRSYDIQNQQLVICHSDKVNFYDQQLELSRSFTSYGSLAPNASQVSFDLSNDGSVWLADKTKGMVNIMSNNSYEAMKIPGPYSSRVHEIYNHKSDIWISSGTVEGYLWQNAYTRDGVFKYSNNEWETFNNLRLPELDTLYDFLSVAIDPLDENKIYFASHGNGVLEIVDGEFSQIYHPGNTGDNGIKTATFSTDNFKYIGASSLGFDNNQNLWVANYGAETVLCAKDQNGEWFSFNFSEQTTASRTGRMSIVAGSNIWVTFPNNEGLLAFDYGGTLGDVSDDEAAYITTAKTNIPSNTVYAIAEDLDGAVWLGTAEGAVYFRSASSVFDNPIPDVEKPLVEQDGYLEYLLESQAVTSIAVDGANRKWMGTSTSGVFLISEDGTEELLHFTFENSPLMSNSIQHIAINGETGEVFFGTEEGVCSYRSDATEGKNDYSDVYAFPNPVEPDYYGDIAITGLIANSEIRITDISGNVVYQTTANGGQAIWNGNTTNGDRVKTGVYLVFCAAPDGSAAVATKILFIN